MSERLWIPDAARGSDALRRVLIAPQLGASLDANSIVLARGSLLRGGASAAEALAVGAAGTVLTSDGTDAAWAALSGRIVSVASNFTTAHASTTSQIPNDDTTPLQATEGAQYATVTMTPTASTNIIIVIAQWSGASNAASVIIANVIFEGTTYRGGTWAQVHGNNAVESSTAFYVGTAGSTSARTYTARFGPQNNTAYINGGSGGRWYNAVNKSGMIVMEIAA